MSGIFKKLILAGGFFFVPLLVNPWSIDVFEVDKISVVRIIGALSLGAVLVTRPSISAWWRDLSLRDPGFWYALLVFWSCVATALSISPSRSFFGSLWREGGLITLLAGYCIFLYFKHHPLTDRFKRFIGYASIAVSAILSLLAIAQWHFHSQLFVALPLITTGLPYNLLRPGATFGHPIYLATVLVLILQFVWYAMTSSSRNSRVWYAAILFLSWCALYLTRSRSAFFVLALLLVVFCLISFTHRRKSQIFSLVALALITVFFSIFARTTLFRFSSANARLNEWKYGAQLILHRPLFGYGAETYEYYSALRTKATNEPADGIADRLHNLELDTAWNSGIVGLAFFIMMLFTTFQNGTGRYLRDRDPWIFTCLISLAAYLVLMQTMFDFSFTYFFLPFLLGTISGGGKSVLAEGSRTKASDALVIAIVTVLSFLLLIPSLAGMLAFRGNYDLASTIYLFWPEFINTK